jgi:hypothetical protein
MTLRARIICRRGHAFCPIRANQHEHFFLKKNKINRDNMEPTNKADDEPHAIFRDASSFIFISLLPN